jgi:hypothetical protein
MHTAGFENDDAFQRRLRDALRRVPPRAIQAPVAAAASDEFGERLSRAAERNHVANEIDRNGDGAGSSPLPSAEIDAGLEVVVQRWPQLPESMRSQIVTIVAANAAPWSGGSGRAE